MVLWDQRGHGRSERGPSDHNSLDQLGRDLRSVIDELAPTGPLTLVGHSMGGMTIMALADQFPDLVQERVFGVGFVATSCGQLSADFAGLPPNLARKVEVALNARQPGRVPLASLIQQVRRTDLNLAATKRNAFGPGAPNSLNRFTVDMLNATPMETVLDFLPTLLAHDKFDALKVFGDIPAFVTCGDADVLTPPSHTRRIASQLPDAQTSVVPGSGHMIQLERSEHITERIAHLAFAADREA
jgi:pimeloyl-ACP methyl ester carboxylesterase